MPPSGRSGKKYGKVLYLREGMNLRKEGFEIWVEVDTGENHPASVKMR